MSVYLASKTLLAIEEGLRKDQASSYRGLLGQVIPHMSDAYRTDEFPFRSHLGASGIGNECARAIWYGWRWATRKQFEGRILRLFNRGHLEEARFIALLLMIGVKVYQQDENGKQFRISDAGGHFGGSGDGILIGVPDLPEGNSCLLECKTSGEKPFLKLKKEGVRAAKFEHYVQCNTYMKKMGLSATLYMVVNKNTDELYAEIIPFDNAIAEQFIDRGVKLVYSEHPPEKISQSPGWFSCKWCDHYTVCHKGATPELNCRTCLNSVVETDGRWSCGNPRSPKFGIITTEQQFEACDKHERKF